MTTVSFLNRLMFKPEEDEYVLGTRKAPPAKVAEARPVVTPDSIKADEDLLENSDSAGD